MLHLIVKAKKLTLSVVSLSLLTAMSCGIIDTEQVTDIIEKQQEVERIRAERIDPLLDQISLVENDTIEPIERQISDLERERDNLFRAMEETEGQKMQEMEQMFRDTRMQERALEDEFRPLETRMRDLHEVERRQMEQEFEKRWREIEMEDREIQEKFEEFHRSRGDGPPPEVQQQFMQIQAAAEEQMMAMHEEFEEKMQSLHGLFDKRMRAGEEEVKNKQWSLQDRRDQLQAHRENLSLQERLGHIQNNIDNYQRELDRLGDAGTDDGETIESLTAQIDAISQQLENLVQTVTDPAWTAKLTDGTLEQGSDAYNAHIADEPNWQIQNPERQNLENQRRNLEEKRNRKNNPEQAARDAERRAEMTQRRDESQKEYDEWAQNLTEVTISAVDTSAIDGEILAVETIIAGLDSEIAAFPEDKKLIQDPAWTDKLLVLTEEVAAVNTQLVTQEEAINNIPVFIPDPNNDAAQIQNPEYTSADAAYAELAMAKAAKQTEYENHIRNAGQVNNPDYGALVTNQAAQTEILNAKKAEREQLLTGGTADSAELPSSEAAIQREQKALNEQMNLLWRTWEVDRQKLEDATRAEVDEGRKSMEKERKQQERLIWGQADVERRKIEEELNKKPPEMIALEEQMYAMNDKRNALEDERYTMEQGWQEKVQVLETEMRSLQERRRNFEMVYRDLEDQRETMFEEAVTPIENQVRDLEAQLDQLFVVLEDAYEQKKSLQKELQVIEREISDLAREAESDVLSLITDAMTAAEELESSGPLDFAKFQAFGEMPGDDEEGGDEEGGDEEGGDEE